MRVLHVNITQELIKLIAIFAHIFYVSLQFRWSSLLGFVGFFFFACAGAYATSFVSIKPVSFCSHFFLVREESTTALVKSKSQVTPSRLIYFVGINRNRKLA